MGDFADKAFEHSLGPTIFDMTETKAAIRKRIRALRDAVDGATRAEWSASVCAQALALPAYRSANTVHVFLSFGSEVDTSMIVRDALKRGKRVVVPAFPDAPDAMRMCALTTLSPDAFDIGVWGTRTPKRFVPIAADEIDLAFVPLAAFERRSDGRVARIGYGKGHYDRFLPQLRAGVPAIGLAFALQSVHDLPVEAHDAWLDAVITAPV
jgi:5-formyltetrahydrofolate cyclo-ligase